MLNILFSEIPFFGISTASYDSKNEDLPVVVPTEKENQLYFEGKLTDKLKKGLVPDFHVLVINENYRKVYGVDKKAKVNGIDFIN